MTKTLTDSIQDYLKAIYELTENGEPATTNALAERLGIAPASVTGMVQKLASAKPALVSYKKHQGVELTEKGRRAALEVIRHHRLIETWLVHTLGYSWDEVHGEAEKLEHVISEDFEKRIAAALGNPVRDPHGELIPTEDLIMPSDESVALVTLQPKQEAVIRRVQAQDTDLLKHLETLGLVIGARVKTLEVSPYDKVMQLQVRGRKEAVVLGPAVTSRVFVEIAS
ncbi:MAG TPA: metal-dependent transcriptional regulator [Anaerolineales bacterium]|nr:metal-dependent transcriptional regulator [Anaerolineales bacterium]